MGERDWNYREVTKENRKDRDTWAWEAAGEPKRATYENKDDVTDPRSRYAESSGQVLEDTRNRNLSSDQFE